MTNRPLDFKISPETNTRFARAQAAYNATLLTQNDKAVQTIASRATDIDDCVELLAMLGLDAHATTRRRGRKPDKRAGRVAKAFP